MVELAHANDYVPDLVGNSHASVEVMSSFVSNVNKFLLRPAEEDWCNQEFFTEMVRMFSDTGYKSAESSQSIWDVVLDVFEWASAEACFGEPVDHIHVTIQWWLDKLEETALVRNFQRRIGPS